MISGTMRGSDKSFKDTTSHVCEFELVRLVAYPQTGASTPNAFHI
jgi:hypothetical protein